MVSLVRLLLLSAAAVAAAPWPSASAIEWESIPNSKREISAERYTLSADPSIPQVKDEHAISWPLKTRPLRRALPPSRMTLEYAIEGRFLFLLGMKIPMGVQDSFYALGPAGPAKALLDNFKTWLSEQDNVYYATSMKMIGYAHSGGVYGVNLPAAYRDVFGFGLELIDVPPSWMVVNDIRDTITQWAQQAGGVVQNILRPNGFYDSRAIGAGAGGVFQDHQLRPRTRVDECHEPVDLLKYATRDMPFIDINRNIRWGGECAKGRRKGST